MRMRAWLCLLSLHGGVLSASESPIAPDGLYINSAQTTTQLATDDQGTAYACYTRSDLALIVAKRPAGSETWSETIVGDTPQADAHYLCSIGIDPLGYVWVVKSAYVEPLAGRVIRSTAPRNIAQFEPATIDGAQAPQVSYPVFYRAGTEFYLLFRNGSSGYGDTWMKRWIGGLGGVWVDVATPILVRADDSQYLGNAYPMPDGDLHLVWTSRIGWQNVGVAYARFDAATGKFYDSLGVEYALPINRFDAENVLADGLADISLANSGLSIALTASDYWIGYNRVTTEGHREAWIARKSIACLPCGWRHLQLSAARLPRVRVCFPPDPVPPSPCDLEVQGPQLLADANTVAALWVESERLGYAGYGRPPGKIQIATTSAGGNVWQRFELPRTVTTRGGEMTRDSSGAPIVLAQSTATASGQISALDLGGFLTIPPAAFNVSIDSRLANTLTLPDTPGWAHPSAFTVVARVRPREGQPMAIVDKPGEFRAVLGLAEDGAWDPTKLQVQVGSLTAWATFPYALRVGEVQTIAMRWDGAEVALYLNGETVAAIPYSGGVADTASAARIGHTDEYPAFDFAGRLTLWYFQVALTPEQIGIISENARE